MSITQYPYLLSKSIIRNNIDYYCFDNYSFLLLRCLLYYYIISNKQKKEDGPEIICSDRELKSVEVFVRTFKRIWNGPRRRR